MRALSLCIATIGLIACRPGAADPVPSESARRVEINVGAGRVLVADLYGSAARGVVILAHGGYSTLARWTRQAGSIAQAGFRVLVIQPHAAAELLAGRETECLYDPPCLAKDVVAGIRYLRESGAKSISLLGGSMGGAAMAQASFDEEAGPIDKLVLLAPAAITDPGRMRGRKLVITTRDDANAAGPRLPGIQAQFDSAPEPKRLEILEGRAHAQRIFETPEGERVLRLILDFLAGP